MYSNVFSVLQNLFLFLLRILPRVCCSSMFKELPLSAVYLWVYGDMKSTSWCYLCFPLWCRSVLMSRGPLSLDMWHGPTTAECYFRVDSIKVVFHPNSFLKVTLNVNNTIAVFPETMDVGKVKTTTFPCPLHRHCEPLSKALNCWIPSMGPHGGHQRETTSFICINFTSSPQSLMSRVSSSAQLLLLVLAKVRGKHLTTFIFHLNLYKL